MESTGIDFTANRRFRIARTNDSGGRLLICGLEERTELLPVDYQNRSVTIGLPDQYGLVKPIHFDYNDSATNDRRLRFELYQSLLEPEAEFDIDIRTTSSRSLHLGIVYRKNVLDKISREYGLELLSEKKCMLRSLALGLGYLRFGAHAVLGTTALIDIVDHNVSVCILNDSTVVALDSLTLAEDFDSSQGNLPDKFAVELKTLLNFRMTTLRQARISSPLSQLVIDGDNLNKQGVTLLQESFDIPVVRPEINKGFLALDQEDTNIVSSRYLVALGLNAN